MYDRKELQEGPPGVILEVQFAYTFTGKIGFWSQGLGIIAKNGNKIWEKLGQKMGFIPLTYRTYPSFSTPLQPHLTILATSKQHTRNLGINKQFKQRCKQHSSIFFIPPLYSE